MIKINEHKEEVEVEEIKNFLYKNNYTISTNNKAEKGFRVGLAWKEAVKDINPRYRGIYLTHFVDLESNYFSSRLHFYCTNVDFFKEEEASFFQDYLNQYREVANFLEKLGLARNKKNEKYDIKAGHPSFNYYSPGFALGTTPYYSENVKKYIYDITKKLPSFVDRANKILDPKRVRRRGRM